MSRIQYKKRATRAEDDEYVESLRRAALTQVQTPFALLTRIPCALRVWNGASEWSMLSNKHLPSQPEARAERRV